MTTTDLGSSRKAPATMREEEEGESDGDREILRTPERQRISLAIAAIAICRRLQKVSYHPQCEGRLTLRRWHWQGEVGEQLH